MQPFIKQRIEIKKPPKFDEIIARFPHAAKHGVLFSWGSTIYNPSNIAIPHWLLVHESVHGLRQHEFGRADAIAFWHSEAGRAVNDECANAWWARYITDAEFMFEEELVAHKAEYDSFCEIKTHGRNERRLYLKGIATRLSGPLYGHAVTFAKARDLIKENVFEQAA